jgi:hypothetical protein
MDGAIDEISRARTEIEDSKRRIMLLSEDNLRLQHRMKELQDRSSGTDDLQLKVHQLMRERKERDEIEERLNR